MSFFDEKKKAEYLMHVSLEECTVHIYEANLLHKVLAKNLESKFLFFNMINFSSQFKTVLFLFSDQVFSVKFLSLGGPGKVWLN